MKGPSAQPITLWAVLLFLTTASSSLAYCAEPSSSELGILKGEMGMETGNFRSRPFIVVYNSNYGEKVLPITEYESNARFEAKLKPGFYSVFIALDGHIPTSRVVLIEAGVTTVYDPTLRPDPAQVWIKDFIPIKMVQSGTVQGRKLELPTVQPIPPR